MKLILPDRQFGAYIFDCDGTLADTMPLHYRAWTRMLEEYGVTMSEDLFYTLGGRPTEQIVEMLRDGHGMRVPDVRVAAARKEEHFLESIHAVKPIETVVQIARQMQGIVPLAVASGGLRKYVELTLQAIGIRQLFDEVICAEDYARAKPFPDPFLVAARRMKVRPEDCVVFEDSPVGMQAAAAAGMHCVFVPRESTS